jgi:nickel/cobalt transporter (NicO) family protein
MNGISVLLLGIGLGLRHATDADHVVVVSALVQREPGMWKAARVAALWGAGHTFAFLTVGALIVLLGVRPSEAFEVVAEVLVSLMLVGVGAWHLVRGGARAGGAPASAAVARPVMIGVVHGVAGSAGIALLAATTIDSRALAAAYLGLVAFGTVFGMVALTVVMSRPIGWTMRREGPLKQGVAIVAALLSMGLGFAMLVGVATGEAAL